MNRLRRKGRRGWGGGGGGARGGLFLILASFFTIIPHSELLSSLLRIPFSYLIPHPEILANLVFPHYPDPENTFTDPVRSRRRFCKKAKRDLISFMGFPQFDGQLYRTNHVTEGSDIRLD